MMAINYYEKSIVEFTEAQNLMYEHQNLGNLYRVLASQLKVKQEYPDINSNEIINLTKQMENTRIQSAGLFSYKRGEKVRNDAYRVEQAEIGFSSKMLIGTDNVNDCLTIIIRDPDTHKTALAHIDSHTDASSLELIFERMPQGADLEAKIVGASYRDDPNTTEDNRWAEIGQSNIYKVLDFLENKNIKILSSDILEGSQPTAIVVDPKTFDIVEAIPNVPNPDKYIANMKIHAIIGERPLRIAFDLTSSSERGPILLRAQETNVLKSQYLEKSEIELKDLFQSWGDSDAQVPRSVHGNMQLSNAYMNAQEQLAEKLDEKLTQLKAEGVEVDEIERRDILDALSESSVYIGENSDLANKPLFDFIQNDLFDISDGYYELRIADLQDIEFTDQPYQVIKLDQIEQTMQLAQDYIWTPDNNIKLN